MTANNSTSFWQKPGTRLGWWALGLLILYGVMYFISNIVFMHLIGDVPWRATVLPYYGVVMIAVGLLAGVVAAIAIIWKHERSVFAWLALLVGIGALVLLAGEFLLPH